MSVARARSSSSSGRENCWLSITCWRREPTAMKNPPSRPLGTGLKGTRRIKRLDGFYQQGAGGLECAFGLTYGVMANPTGQTKVTTEVAFCPFCNRPRNLRREERQLGALALRGDVPPQGAGPGGASSRRTPLVRTTVTCESCHRTLSSSMGVATAEPAAPSLAQPEAPPADAAAGADHESALPPPTGTKSKASRTRPATKK